MTEKYIKASECEKYFYEHLDDNGMIGAMNAIDEMPAADVQPVKHGKWKSSQRTIETGTVYCSNCAIEYYISDLQTVGDCNGIAHYCPNCGARMDAEPDEPWQSE